jgi:hypothetical protein
MCHNAVHQYFTNDEIAQSFYSVELLLGDSQFRKYVKRASNIGDHGSDHAPKRRYRIRRKEYF